MANRPVMTRTFNLPATADALQLRVLDVPDESVFQKEADRAKQGRDPIEIRSIRVSEDRPDGVP